MKGVVSYKTKTVVSLGALQLFFDAFDDHEMVRALVRMCVLAESHPDFGKGENSHAEDAELADLATFALWNLSGPKCYSPEESPPCTISAKNGTISIPAIAADYRPPMSLDRARVRVPVKLLRRSHAGTRCL